MTHILPFEGLLLAAAWGILSGGLWSSFFGQLYNPAFNDISGLPNMTVVCFKLVIYRHRRRRARAFYSPA
jgi:hypothetical protein